MKFEAITIKDIAKALGLSTSTVSRALRDSYEISPETKEMYSDEAVYCKKFEFVCGEGKTCKRWEHGESEGD